MSSPLQLLPGELRHQIFRYLERHFMERLKPCMTADMYSQLMSKFPEMGSQIREDSEDRFWRTPKEWRKSFLSPINTSDLYYNYFHFAREFVGPARPRGDWWKGGQFAIQGSLSFALRLIAEQDPAEFARVVYEDLPEWVNVQPARKFLDISLAPWAIPSQAELATIASLISADTAYQIIEPWHESRAQPVVDPRELVHINKGLRCREKIRFSAAAVAIRFLERLPTGHRLQIGNITLREDHPSVGLPSGHAQGLAPFFKENPKLRVERRVSLMRCIIEEIRLEPPQHMAWRLELKPQPGANFLRHLDFTRINKSLGMWLQDALAVTDAGIPADGFTFVLEGGPYADFCSDYFQKQVHQHIAFRKAYQSCRTHGLGDEEAMRTLAYYCTASEEGLELAVNQMINHDSVLRCDFSPGHPRDVEELVQAIKGYRHNDVFLGPMTWEMMEIPPELTWEKIWPGSYEIDGMDEPCEPDVNNKIEE